jgi:hypothetical protein
MGIKGKIQPAGLIIFPVDEQVVLLVIHPIPFSFPAISLPIGIPQTLFLPNILIGINEAGAIMVRGA